MEGKKGDRHFFIRLKNACPGFFMEVDYRRGGHMVDYIPCKIPRNLEVTLFALMRELKLFSGCIDLIENVDGEFIFLEVNSEGIWGKHDDIYDRAISRAFANALIEISSKGYWGVASNYKKGERS